MPFGFSTPLLDFFKRGDVERDLRLLAAQGTLAPRAQEQIGLLMLLVEDRDAEIAATAEATLKAIPADSVAEFLARSDVPTEMRTFFAARGIEPGGSPGDESEAALVDQGEEPEKAEDENEGTTVQRIAAMVASGA